MKTPQLLYFLTSRSKDKHIASLLKHKSTNKIIHKTYQNNSHLMNVILFQVKTVFVCNSAMFYGTSLYRQPLNFVDMSSSSKKALLSTAVSTEGL